MSSLRNCVPHCPSIESPSGPLSQSSSRPDASVRFFCLSLCHTSTQSFCPFTPLADTSGSDRRPSGRTPDAELVLFAAEPENAFREVEADVNRIAALLRQAWANAPAAEVAERRRELEDICANLGSALSIEQDSTHVLPDATEDDRELARCRIQALKDALA
jgi:hypothetical protein